MQTITKNGVQIPVEGNDVEMALSASIFKKWIDQVDDTFTISKIFIQSVDKIPNGKILFMKVKVTVHQPNGSHDLIVFLHHNVVSGLCVLTCEGKRYVVVVNQPRLPVGRRIYELPAGLIDDGTSPESVILRELEEEAGLVTHVGLTAADVVLLNPGSPMIGSPGIMNVSTYAFLVEREITAEQLKTLNGLKTGLEHEHEDIVVSIVPYEEVTKYCHDTKTLATLYLYEHRND